MYNDPDPDPDPAQQKHPNQIYAASALAIGCEILVT
jgi:hypothetical protein